MNSTTIEQPTPKVPVYAKNVSVGKCLEFLMKAWDSKEQGTEPAKEQSKEQGKENKPHK